MVFHGEVNFGGLPFIAQFVEQGGDQAQEGGFIGEEAGDAGTALEFLVDPFQGIAGAQSELVGEWQGEDGEALGQAGFHPGGEFGSAGGIEGDDFLEASFSGWPIRAVEHTADGVGDGGALVQAGDIGLGILLEVELAALPRHGRKDRGARCAHAGMVIADHELDAVETALLQALEELAPMDFGFAQRDADAQNGAFALGVDAQGDEDGAIQELAPMADLFVAGIQDQAGKGTQGAGAPGLELGIELGGALTDLGRANGGAAELLERWRRLCEWRRLGHTFRPGPA